MTITAAQVKELREKSGAGMMDAKKALVENNGDMDAALDWLRTKGIAKAEKKSGRVAAEGVVLAVSEGNKGAMVEVNSETDFVAKNEKFREFTEQLAALVLKTGITSVEELRATEMNGKTVADTLTDLVATIGENMNIRRAAYAEAEGQVASYVHMGGKIGVLVATESKADVAERARQIAMHVAANNPAALDESSVDQEMVARERQVLIDQAKESGKPQEIAEKMVEGRMKKFLKEICLVDQPFVMNPDQTVAQALAEADADAKIVSYTRFGLGEGIEKEEGDFAAEVAAAVNG